MTLATMTIAVYRHTSVYLLYTSHCTPKHARISTPQKTTGASRISPNDFVSMGKIKVAEYPERAFQDICHYIRLFADQIQTTITRPVCFQSDFYSIFAESSHEK